MFLPAGKDLLRVVILWSKTLRSKYPDGPGCLGAMGLLSSCAPGRWAARVLSWRWWWLAPGVGAA